MTCHICAKTNCIGECEPKIKPAQQQEPVAVVSGYYGGQCVILPIDPARIFNSNTALYTFPPPCPTCEALARTVMLDQTSHDAQRKPLTKTKVGNYLRRHAHGEVGMYRNGFKDGVTFAEAVHGIKEPS